VPDLSPFLGLPHRPPFVFVRKLIRCEPGLSAETETFFARDDPMFAGHFPGILTEALAQTAGIAAASGGAGDNRPFFLLSAIRTMKFFRAVRPEELVILRAEKQAEAGGLLQFKVEATVEGARVAEGHLVLSAAVDSGRTPE
jgi:3-hydroxyacyl-[acyl-carrier-protein] dehydratase